MNEPARCPPGPLPSPVEPAPSLVLFDLDDTLCDYAGARAGRLRTAFSQALTRTGNDHRATDLDELVAESIAIHPHGSDHFGDLLERYGIRDEAVIASTRDWYHTNRFLGFALYDGAVTLLETVRRALPGRRIGVITNGPAEVQRAKVALLRLAPAVDFVLISGEFGIAKPEPAIFHEALRLGQATPAEAIVIGDSPEIDIAGAQAVGIPAVWMNHRGLAWPADIPPAVEVRSFAEIAALLGG